MTPMTDKQKEAAARELCRLRGLDPDELLPPISYRHLPPIERWREYVVYWIEPAASSLRRERIEQALAVGRESPP